MIFLNEKIYDLCVYNYNYNMVLNNFIIQNQMNFYILSEFINRNLIRMKNVYCFELIYNVVILDGCLWNLKDWISVKDVIKFYL